MKVHARLAIVTCSKHPQLFAEEQQLPAAFARRGASAVPVVWDDPAVDWSGFDALVVRSTWDYIAKIARFRDWLGARRAATAAGGPRLVNCGELLEWNLDKRYLAELARAGVPIVPTEFVDEGGACDLRSVLRAHGWSRAVIKPAVSAGGFRTHVVTGDGEGEQAQLDKILGSSAALIQPFLPEIQTVGEHSVLVFADEPAYALVKRPAPGEFRVQFTHGGTYERVALTSDSELARAARAVMGALPHPATYARVDGVLLDGRFHLMEAELLEPYLHLSIAPEMTERFVDAVLKIQQNRPTP